VKHLLPVAVLAATLATVAAASAAPASAPTKKPGVLTVAFGDSAVGFAAYTLRGQKVENPKGYEADLARAVAKQMGISKINWIYVPWTGLFAPGTKKFDVSFQEATITPQRKKTVNFSSPYLDSNQGVLISHKAKAPKSIAQLKKMQTCAQVDTTGLDWIKTKLHPNKAPLQYQTTAAAFTAVQINKCDALILDVPIVLLQDKSAPTNYGGVVAQIVTNEKYGAVFQKGSKLVKPFDAALAKLNANGTIAKLRKKWFNVADFKTIPVIH
jgi:polar amino acid transport system substrate-binding protein